MNKTIQNHGHKFQSKLQGIIPSAVRDCSTDKFQCTSFSKFESHNKVHIISLGCPKNLIDSEVMGGLLNQSGHQLIDHSESADIVIVNTCAFINPAKEEAIEEILTLAEEKKKTTRGCGLSSPAVSPSATAGNFSPKCLKWIYLSAQEKSATSPAT